MRTITDTETVWKEEAGIAGGFKRSIPFYVGSADTITLSIHTGTGSPIAQKVRVFGSIKTIQNDGYTPVDIDESISADNLYAPLGFKDMNDGGCYKGSDGIPVLADKNGLFQLNIRGISYIFFEMEGAGVPVSLFIRTYN